jgi:methionine synthase reductase
MDTANKGIWILFGSEKGNSECIAHRIFNLAKEKGYDSAELHCLDTWQKVTLIQLTRLTTQLNLGEQEGWPTRVPLIFVASSTGAGDPPANAERFWRMLRRNAKKVTLRDVPFALLGVYRAFVKAYQKGLGDTNYDNYQGFPVALWKKMTELGASPFYERGIADDATGYNLAFFRVDLSRLEEVVEPWIDGLWGALESYFSGNQASSATPAKQAPPSSGVPEETRVEQTPSPSAAPETTSAVFASSAPSAEPKEAEGAAPTPVTSSPTTTATPTPVAAVSPTPGTPATPGKRKFLRKVASPTGSATGSPAPARTHVDLPELTLKIEDVEEAAVVAAPGYPVLPPPSSALLPTSFTLLPSILLCLAYPLPVLLEKTTPKIVLLLLPCSSPNV